jgi:hypothetical protein
LANYLRGHFKVFYSIRQVSEEHLEIVEINYADFVSTVFILVYPASRDPAEH